MRRKVRALIFCKSSLSAETLKALHAPGMKEALLSASTFRIGMAEPCAEKTDLIGEVADNVVFFGNRLSVVVVGETGAGKTAFMSRLISEFSAGGSGDRLPD